MRRFKRRTERGEGPTAEKVRVMIEAEGYTNLHFTFGSPMGIHTGEDMSWEAFGKDANGWSAHFCSWDSLSSIVRAGGLSIVHYPDDVFNHFEVHAGKEVRL